MIQRFARLRDGYVIRLHVLNVDAMLNENGEPDEMVGSTLLAELHDDVPENFIACDREDHERGLFVRPGYVYDRNDDVFRPPQPFASWVFDAGTWQWVAPVATPDDGQKYYWDEESTSWMVAAEIPTV